MARKKIANTWWGNLWVDFAEQFIDDSLIYSGRRIIKQDGIKNVEIEDNTVTAKVRSKSRKYNKVFIEFHTLDEDEIKIIYDLINNDPFLLSSLLNNKLPDSFFYKLLENDIDIFPSSYLDYDSTCQCYSWDYRCEHQIALVQYLGIEIDKDPFLLFKLRGCDLLKLLKFDNNVNGIKTSSEIISVDDENLQSGIIDFSTIPALSDEIFILLDENPTFFKKDFKNILNRVYKALPKLLRKDVEKYTRQSEDMTFNYRIKLGRRNSVFKGDEEEYTDWLEDMFLKRWDMPNNWSQFKLHVNKNYQITYIKNGNNSYFKNTEISPEFLFNFFTELSESPITKFNFDIQFLNILYNFSLEIIKKNAFIPDLIKFNNKFVIRWIPAIFDRNISEIINHLASDCPDNLLKFKNKRISKVSQIITIVSLFIKGFIEIYFNNHAPKMLLKDADEKIFKLFFFDGMPIKKNYSLAQSVNQWFSKFNLISDLHDLYFVVDEVDDYFKLDIRVNDDLESFRDLIYNTKDINLKIELIKDLNLICDVYPDYKESFIDNEDILLGIEEFSEFFLNTLPLFELMGIKIILPKSINRQFKPNLTLNIYSNSKVQTFVSFKDLTDFDWKVQIGDNQYDVDEFKNIAENSKGFVKLANNYVMLDKNEVKSLIKQINKIPKKLTEHDLLHSMLAGEFRDAKVNMDDNLKNLISNMVDIDDVEIPKAVNADLRPYQEVGFSWLVQNIKTGFGSILADDMGLGKTLEVLTTIQYFKDDGFLEKEKILIVAPTSLLINWQKEINKFTPDLTSFIYYGADRKFPDEEYDIYLTSYGIIRRDVEDFNTKKWFLLIVDEAQNIKNPQAKQTRAVKSLKSKNKIAMTGTPVENRLSDYWSIFDFINKGYLTNLKKFKKEYIVPIEKELNNNVLDNFKKITSPFILRRVKSDKNIIQDLPDKIVNDVYCDLSQKQIAFYKETVDEAMDEIRENDGIQRKGLVLKLINSLKQICNHPSQFMKSDKYDIEDSGKLMTLMDVLQTIFESNEKVLIFTQYRQMGEIIKDAIQKHFNTDVLFLHGSVKMNQRNEMIEEFQTNSQVKVFVMTLKTGGTGLNLTSANNVIHYDLWWNPAVENQATDRAYRIGQYDNVMVYRFITSKTFEEKINDIISQKEYLANQTVNQGETFITEMNDDDLKELMMLR